MRSIARLTERIGLWWAITVAFWAPKHRPVSLAEARYLHRTTPRNSLYDAHTPGVKRKAGTP